MLEGGNAVDAMIASFLCIGVVNPQSSGLGGGFLMTSLQHSEVDISVQLVDQWTAPNVTGLL